MIRNGSVLLGAGLLLAGLTAPVAANARSHDTGLAVVLTAAVNQASHAVHPRVASVSHQHHHRAPRYQVPPRTVAARYHGPAHAVPSRKALKRHDDAYRKYEREHIRLYGHAPRGCRHHAPPRHHYGRR